MRARMLTATAAIASILLLAACGDARLDKLSLGISKDSATAVMGEPPQSETGYLTAGKLWNVEFCSRTSAGPKDSIPWGKMSPIILINGKVVGWGWHWWRGEAAKQHIPMPEK